MSQKIGRRKLKACIAKLQGKNRDQDALEAKARKLEEQARYLQRQLNQCHAERVSITDMIGGLNVHINKGMPHYGDRIMRLSVDINTEYYMRAFDYGRGNYDRFRNLSGYFHMIAQDVAYKVERALAENASELMKQEVRSW